MADRQESLAHFLALTGADEATALNLLEAADWNLEQAVELHFHSTGADDPPPARAAAGPSSRPPATYQSDEELARSLAAEGGGGGMLQDDEVRAPLPTRTERLYGDNPGPGGYVPGMIDRAMRGLSQSRSQHINAFQDFRAAADAANPEGTSSSAARAEEGLLAAAASSSGAAAAAGGAAGGSQTPGLSDLFRPPQDILLVGDFEMAKHKAGNDGKWLLVNVQSPTEFASHQLNRDTWGNTLVKDLIKAQFVFWQTNYDTPEGMKVSAYYHLTHDFPVVLIIDSITGAKIWQRNGYIEAEKLLEELVPFMDHGPQDSGAALLAQTSLKRRHAAMARGAASTSTAAAAAPAAAGLSEEEELARAIAMSMQDQTGAGKQDEDEEFQDVQDMDEDDAMLEAAIAASAAEAAEAAAPAVDLVAVAAKAREEASARLPAEPEDGPASCRVAIRCPDGSRKQRRFNKTDAVQTLIDYCILEVEEAAVGRVFRLVPTYPGATALTNPAETLQAAGVANAMLALQWAD